MAIFAVIGLSMGADRSEVREWLLDNDLWNAVTPWEAAFIDNPRPPEQQIIDASWMSERLLILVWALGCVEALPAADEQCDVGAFQALLPPYADLGVADFVEGAALRPNGELLQTAETLLNLHAWARPTRHNLARPRTAVDLGVVRERHHAINWVIGHEGLAWDEVTTDT